MRSFVHSEGDDPSIVVKHAILVYETTGYSQTGRKSGYATVHPVEMVNDRPMVMPGTTATVAGVREALQGLTEQVAVMPELLHPQVLGMWESGFAFYLLPARRRMFVSNASAKVTGSAIVPHPGLIFTIDSGTWKVWAYKGTGRPAADTVLYRAPHPNTFKDASICTGTTLTPGEAGYYNPEAWEKSYFSSSFSNYQSLPPKARWVKYTGGAHAFLSDWFGGKFETFPENVLEPQEKGLTLGKMIVQLREEKQGA